MNCMRSPSPLRPHSVPAQTLTLPREPAWPQLLRVNVTASLGDALVGRYTIERELGRGGMATVYLARDLKHDRLVALKVLDPELGAVLGVERFLSEIRVTANLQHPHLLPLFDSGSADGLLYYVMPYVEGESLRARLERERQLPVDEALRLTIAVLSALAYAHEHGVIHRDLKPENILLQRGEPVVADFGIALAVSKAGGQRVTQTGLSLGTPQYMSPEQATGDRMIDARSDIYSMGAVLYEMLTGEPPHTGASVQAIIAKLLTERPRSMRSTRDTVSEPVDAATMKALAKVPADRWSTAQEFAEALRGSATIAIREGRGALALLARRARHVTRSMKAWRIAAGALLAVAALLAWLAFRPHPPSPELQLARQLTSEGDVIGAAISPDGAWLAYVSDDCFGQTYTCTSTLQVREVDGTRSVKLVTWPTLGTGVRWSPDGATVGFIGAPDSTAPALYLIPRLGGTPQRVGGPARAWTFAPDGKVVEIVGPSGNESLVWLDPHTLAPTDSATLPPGLDFNDLAANPDNRSFAASGVAGGALALVLIDGRGRLLDSTTAFNFRPDIRWDATHTGVLALIPSPGTTDNLLRIPVSRGKLGANQAQVVLGQVSDGVGTTGTMDASPSGRVSIVDGPTSFEILTLKLGDPTATWTPLTHRTSWVWGQQFSPDGASLAGSATDNLGDNIYLFPLSGAPPRPLSEQRGIRDYPFLSPDGQHIAFDALTPEATPIGTIFTDVAGGREHVIQRGFGLGSVIGWTGNDAVVLGHERALVVVDTTGRIRRRILLPHSLAPGTAPYTDAASQRAAYWSPNAGAVIVVDLASGKLSRLVSTKSPVQPVGWGSDGSLFVTGKAADQRALPPGTEPRRDLVLERLPPGGTAFVRVATLPNGCWTDVGAVTVGVGGTLAACTVRRFVPDVWLADRAGKSGW